MKVELSPKVPLNTELKLPENNTINSFEKIQADLDELTVDVQYQITQISKLSKTLDMLNDVK